MIGYNEFIKLVSKETGYSQNNIREVLDNAEAVMIDSLKRDEGIKILKTISIVPSHKDATEARNPFTGGTVMVPAKRVIKAKISKSLKELVK